MHYTVYRVTCLVNGKTYVGKHKTTNLNDGYFGSGKVLRAALNKHGAANFTREIVADYAVAWKMNIAERILAVFDPETSYNLRKGGDGGFDHINRLGLNWSPEKMRAIAWREAGTLKRRRAASFGGHASKGNLIPGAGLANALGDASRQKRRATFAAIGHQKGCLNSQFGKPRSEETKRRIAESMRLRKQQSGEDK